MALSIAVSGKGRATHSFRENRVLVKITNKEINSAYSRQNGSLMTMIKKTVY